MTTEGKGGISVKLFFFIILKRCLNFLPFFLSEKVLLFFLMEKNAPKESKFFPFGAALFSECLVSRKKNKQEFTKAVYRVNK